MADAPTRHVEIETKLELAPGKKVPDLAGVRAVKITGVAIATAPVVHELDANYFDTETLDLLSARITLRRRTGGDDAGWHLKLPAGAGARTEIGLPLDAGGDASTVPDALLDLIRGAARGRPLRPVARLQNRRTATRLTDKSGAELVEVADDQVTATRLAADGSAIGEPTGWRELEAELIGGRPEHLAAVTAALQQAGAQPARSASKLARALEPPTTAAPATEQRKQPRTAGPAIVAALTRLRDQLISADVGLRSEAPDALHDARAAARRVRSVLEVYAPLFGPPSATRALRARLRDHGRVLSAARDCEVVVARLRRQLVDEPGEFAAAASARIETEFAARFRLARAAVAEHLSSPELFAMIIELDAFLADPPTARRAARAARTELPHLLARAWSQLDQLAAVALADPDHAPGVHATRKQAKVLRYAAEAATASIGENAVLFAAAIEEVQEILGEYQDAVTTAELLAEMAVDPATDGTAGFVFGRLHAFEQATVHGSLDEFADAWDRVRDGELLAVLRGE